MRIGALALTNSVVCFGADRWTVPLDAPYPIAPPFGPFFMERCVEPLRARACRDYSIRLFFLGLIIICICLASGIDISMAAAREWWRSVLSVSVEALVPPIALILMLSANALFVRQFPSSGDYKMFEGLFRNRMSETLFTCLANSLRIREKHINPAVVDLRFSLSAAISALANPSAVVEEERARVPLVSALEECVQEKRFEPAKLNECFGKRPTLLATSVNIILALTGTALIALSAIGWTSANGILK